MTKPKTATITENELQAEYERIDALRVKTYEPLLTDEQFQLIAYARNGATPVTWIKLVQYFESRGWGNYQLTTLKSRYQTECMRRTK